ncbi:MAG: hypothetical protein ACREH8_12690 [Opitutaceae bacterium]
MNWSDLPRGCRTPANRISPKAEDRILSIRRFLRERSDLGECGPQAIRDEMIRRRLKEVPSARTIARILGRRGALDGRRRQRWKSPPRGWFLCDAAARRAELDSFDIIEDLVIAGGTDVNVLTGISLHGGLCAAWPAHQVTAKFTVQSLIEHWRMFGLPNYAKFDNDTVFQGAHQHPDSFGRVTRLCLSLGVAPVFAPPRETGFQADIESFNGRWQTGVWRRFRFADLPDVGRQSRKYVIASRRKSAGRIQDAPARRAFPDNWRFDLQAPLRGMLIFLRRTDERGHATLLGHTYMTSPDWCSRLVRAEVDLDHHQIRFYALRRREPNVHRYLSTHAYEPPRKSFQE